MTRPFQLESFSSASRPSADTPSFSPEELEAARLKGYDAGYQSGWDDAMQQVEQDQSRISEEFARNLRDLGFTYHEARAHVISSLEPLVESLLNALFPTFAAEAIATHIQSLLQDHADKAAAQPMRLRVSPTDIEALRSLLTEQQTFPLEIIEEQALATGQAQLLLGKSEYRVDLSDVVNATQNALSALKESNERTMKRA